MPHCQVEKHPNGLKTEPLKQKVIDLCKDLHARITEQVQEWGALLEQNENWREEVFRGVRSYDAGTDCEIRKRLEEWLSWEREAGDLIGVLVSQRCEPGMRIAADYLRCVDEARKTLNEWEAPEVSNNPVLRENTLSMEQSRKLREVLGTDW